MAFAGRVHMEVAMTANARIIRHLKGVVTSVPQIDGKIL